MDAADVSAGLQDVGGIAMTQHMRMDPLLDASLVPDLGEHLVDTLASQSRAGPLPATSRKQLRAPTRQAELFE